MRVLEFVGLPASGKSTLNRRLFDTHDMTARGVYTSQSIRELKLDGRASKWDILRSFLRPLIASPRRGLGRAAGPHTPSHADLVLSALTDSLELVREVLDAVDAPGEPVSAYASRMLLRSLISYEYAKRYLGEDDTFWVEDEGFCRGAANTYLRYSDVDVELRISRYVSLCPPLDYLVCLNIDPALALRRVKERVDAPLLEDPIYRGLSDETIVALYRKIDRITETAKLKLREKGTQIIEIDTSTPDGSRAAAECVQKLRTAGLGL